MTSPSPSSETPSASARVVAWLNQVLADAFVLSANTRFAHWNVEGREFFALHAAFDDQAEALDDFLGQLARRIRALEAYVPGGPTRLASLAAMAEFAAPRPPEELLAGLLQGHEKIIADAASLRDVAGLAGDAETQDLAIQLIQWHQKTIWMLRSALRSGT